MRSELLFDLEREVLRIANWSCHDYLCKTINNTLINDKTAIWEHQNNLPSLSG